MRRNRPMICLCLLLPWAVGCMSISVDPDAALPTRIGEPRERDTTGMEPFEATAVGLLDYMTDAAVALAHVKDIQTSEHVAKLVDEARPGFVKLRAELQAADADRKISDAELILKYGGRYIWATYQFEQELKRIKQLGPEVYDPLRASVKRLQDELKQAGLPDKP